MVMKRLICLSIGLMIALVAGTAVAQTPPPPPPAYGAPITLEQAKKVMAGAEAEAKKNNWGMVITILDPGGHPVMMQRLDGTHSAASRSRRTRPGRRWRSGGPPRSSRTRSPRAAPTSACCG
jgi:hypothetical protein